MSFSVIITAGGIGKRMGFDIPKQFIEIAGFPILMHTIRCFFNYNPTCQILVTLPEEWKNYWGELIDTYDFDIPHDLISGGKERYDSIKNALLFCQHDLIAVHDGVRPLVSSETIERCFQLVKSKGAVIPVLTLKESLRVKGDNISKSVERKNYLSVQTPQFFSSELLKNAYKIPFHSNITDDASLVEEAGYIIATIEGNEENIKITTPFDLKIAEVFLK